MQKTVHAAADLIHSLCRQFSHNGFPHLVWVRPQITFEFAVAGLLTAPPNLILSEPYVLFRVIPRLLHNTLGDMQEYIFQITRFLTETNNGNISLHHLRQELA